MSRKKHIIGNWKMNKTPIETKKFMDEFKEWYNQNENEISDNTIFGIAPSSINIKTLFENSINDKFLIAAQNINQNKSGAFTGEISLEMIKSVGANSVILGHSERRAMFNETSEIVAQKAIRCIEEGITPIIAFGETLEEYENGKTKDIVKKMVEESTRGVDLSKIILAYEPIWAIGTGKTASTKDAQDVCAFVREITQKDVIIQYGGSVKAENIKELMLQKDIDGALVGGASLNVESFVQLLTWNK